MLQWALIKLHYCLFLIVGFDRALSQFANVVDGFDPRYLPCLHQVAGQHGPGPAVTVHAVNSNALKENRSPLLCMCVCVRVLFLTCEPGGLWPDKKFCSVGRFGGWFWLISTTYVQCQYKPQCLWFNFNPSVASNLVWLLWGGNKNNNNILRFRVNISADGICLDFIKK